MKGKKVEAMIDFMPELSTEKMLDFFKEKEPETDQKKPRSIF